MSVNYNPRTVTDGLVFALDAANTKSYDKYENLLTYSEEFNTNWNKTQISIVSSNIVSPDGTTNAIKQVETTASGLHRNAQGVSKSAVATTYTFSIFVKAGERNGFEFGMSDAGGYVDCFVNSTTGAFFAVPSINGSFVLGSYGSIPYPNGWYRFYVTATTTAQTSVNVFCGTTLSVGNTNNYTGDGTSGIYVWGAQLEKGSTANDYYSTTASTKTRGTTLTDLSLTKNTTTLTNTPTFSNTNGGYLSFASASSQYATAPNLGSLSRWTLETFVRFTSSYSTKVAMVVGGQYDLSSNLNFTIGTNNAPTNYNIAVGFFNGAWRSTTGINYALNTWHHIVGTYDGTTIRQYTNGTQVDSLNYTGTPSSGGEVRINRRWDDVVSSGNLFDSDIATVRIYNRALTAAEVQQNFNATRARFSI
jgi:hypothetical protein